MFNHDTINGHLRTYLIAAERILSGDYGVDLPISDDSLGQLGYLLRALAQRMREQEEQTRLLDTVMAAVSAGVRLPDILDSIYINFRRLIPFNRLGFALIEDNDEGQPVVRAQWARTDQALVKVTGGYALPLQNTSLGRIMETGQPRIINDLLAYLKEHPTSESTRLIVEEGMRSSLTCPLKIEQKPIGFLFFSSTQSHFYSSTHVNLFKHIADQVAIIVQRGRLITEMEEQRAIITAKNEELERANETKNTFLSMAAHDLRNPIGTIQSAVNLLMDYSVQLSQDEQRIILEDMFRQSGHMVALIDDLLDVARIESGRLDLAPRELDLHDFLINTVRAHKQTAGKKNISVILHGEKGSHLTADPIRIKQVLDNLLSNAIKYSPPGSTIHVRAEEEADHVRISVQDEGPGIKPEDRTRLFQDFARLSAKPTGGERSVGLGLAISRRIVEAHQGSIGVDSTPGQGSTFWFRLPTDLTPELVDAASS